MQARELRRPLARSEHEELAAFLSEAPEALSLPGAYGLLTGIALAPTAMMPSAWHLLLFGDTEFASQAEAEKIFGFTLRVYNEIVTALEEDQAIVPEELDDDAIADWCAGYLMAAREDEVWTADETAVLYLFPMSVLAGEFDLVGEQDENGAIIEDATQHLRRYRERLDVYVHAANEYWTQWRSKQATRVATRPPKVGRNEPCPCGSGRKFKKCCEVVT